MITFLKLTILFAVVLCCFFWAYLYGKKKGFEDGYQKGQIRPGNRHFNENLRPLLLGFRELEPSYEETNEMGVDRRGNFYFIDRCNGGSHNELLCGIDGKICKGDCFKRNALYFDNDGNPLFFCRYYYTIFKGNRYSEYQVDPKLVELYNNIFKNIREGVKKK